MKLDYTYVKRETLGFGHTITTRSQSFTNLYTEAKYYVERKVVTFGDSGVRRVNYHIYKEGAPLNFLSWYWADDEEGTIHNLEILLYTP